MRISGFLLGFLLLLGSALSTGQEAPAPSLAQTAASTPASSFPPDSQIRDQSAPARPSDARADTASKQEGKGSSSEGGHKLHFRLGTIAIGAGYTHFSGPAYYYPYGPYEFYPPFWALFGPYPYPFFAPDYFAYGSAKGEVRLTAEPKDAAVYLDHAYAGTADHLKRIWLEPGAYDLSLSAAGREPFQQRIYVLSGKSVKISAKLVPAVPSAKTEEQR